MAEWNREKVDSTNLNKGQEWTKNDQVALEELNAMVNSGLYAQDFVEKLVENIDVSEIDNVGTPTVELVDGDDATAEKPYKKFKFSNFKGDKGDKGDFGADYDSLINKPIINADISTLSVSNVVVNQIYRHTGESTETLIENKLYFSNGTEWVAYGDDGNSKVNFVDNLTTTTNLPQLNMNRLTEEELASAKDEGTLNANELYMTEDVTEDDTKANVDASNLSDTNVESWRDKLGKGKMLYYERRYNAGTVFNGHDTLFTTTINSPTNSVLVYLNYCDSLSHRTSWVKITLGKQESRDLAFHDYTTNNSWKSVVWVFNNVPKNTDLTLSIALYSQEDSVTITLPAYNEPDCLVVSI